MSEIWEFCITISPYTLMVIFFVIFISLIVIIILCCFIWCICFCCNEKKEKELEPEIKLYKDIDLENGKKSLL